MKKQITFLSYISLLSYGFLDKSQYGAKRQRILTRQAAHGATVGLIVVACRSNDGGIQIQGVGAIATANRTRPVEGAVALVAQATIPREP